MPRPGLATSRSSGPVAEFLPLVAWALVADDEEAEADRVVGVLIHDNFAPELVVTDDPSFLGYAGPGDPAVDRAGLTPDWRALARKAISELKTVRHSS